MNVLGLDIGGAHIKVATCRGVSNEYPFPIWKMPDQLAAKLNEIARCPDHAADHIAVTMTAELADCYAHKRDGVAAIVQSVEGTWDAAVSYYQTNGEFVDAHRAIERYLLTSASNWHALASYLFSTGPESGFVLDIGSTTVDIIPVRDRVPVYGSQTDLDRLENSQLIYTGCERTPVCSLLSSFDYQNRKFTVAREVFATIGDVYRWLGKVACDSNCRDTADGRSQSKQDSGQRLARMLCSDLDEIGEEIVTAFAGSVADHQLSMLWASLLRVLDEHSTVPRFFRISGGGNWLAVELVEKIQSACSAHFSWEVVDAESEGAQCLPALGVARLLKSRLPH